MANAVAQEVPGTMNVREDGFSIDYQMYFTGGDIPGGGGSDISQATVEFVYDEDGPTMTGRIGAAVRAEAQRLGYTVPDGACVVAGFDKV